MAQLEFGWAMETSPCNDWRAWADEGNGGGYGSAGARGFFFLLVFGIASRICLQIMMALKCLAWLVGSKYEVV